MGGRAGGRECPTIPLGPPTTPTVAGEYGGYWGSWSGNEEIPGGGTAALTNAVEVGVELITGFLFGELNGVAVFDFVSLLKLLRPLVKASLLFFDDFSL